MHRLYGGTSPGGDKINWVLKDGTGIYKQGNYEERKSIQLMRISDKNNKNAYGQASEGRMWEQCATSPGASVKQPSGNGPPYTGSSPEMLKRGP